MSPSKIRTTVQHYFNDYPIDKSRPIVVGLSGGADSVALLFILKELGYSCHAAHCNFQLRGEESVRDLHFAQQIAQEAGVPFHTVTFDTTSYAQQHKLSIEMACRELRYNWFRALCSELDAPCLAVAHHRDDSVETVLLNLMRGTGIAGLTGIRPVNGHIIRPLLALSRTDIEQYLTAIGVAYIVDSTNQQTIYTRNKVRLELLPLMQTINPSVAEAIERTATHLAEVERVYRAAIATQIAQVVTTHSDTLTIDIPSLLQQPSPSALLFEIIKAYGFTTTQLSDILQSATAPSGRVFDAPAYQLLKDRTHYIISPRVDDTPTTYYIEQSDTSLDTPIQLIISHIERTDAFQFPTSPLVACFDKDKLHYPLELRRWQQGDRFTPLGMRGSKKVSDYFSDHKFTLFDKQQTWVLLSAGKIVWIVGHRISDDCKVTNKSTQIVQLEKKNS